MTITVGELQELFQGIDPDKPVHFFLDDERCEVFDRWATPLGPMIILKLGRAEKNLSVDRVPSVTED